MSSTLRQTGRELDDLIGAVESFADDPAQSTRVASALAEAGEGLVRAGFSAHRAPDGTAWAPLKRPRLGVGGPLLKTGALRDAASLAVVSAHGFVMTAPYPKSVHQRGYARRNLPARPFFPGAGRLPPVWDVVMEAAADAALEVPA